MRCKAFFQTALWAIFPLFAISASMQANDRPVIVPFYLQGNSILVQATVNGQTGNFLIDTGVPQLVLNSAYFQGVDMQVRQHGINDLHGNTTPALLFALEEFSLGALSFPEKYALVTDLQAVAAIKGTSLFGIIGYSTLKNFELHFDFELQELAFLSLGKKGEPLGNDWADAPTEIFELKFSSHIPYFITMAGDKKVRMGIDSGSEVNLLHEHFFEKTDLTLDGARTIQIHGLSGEHGAGQRGHLAGISLEDHIAGPMDVTLTDLQAIHDQLPINLDGILGVAYLKKVRFSINYKKREFCIWSLQKERVLAENLRLVEANSALVSPEK